MKIQFKVCLENWRKFNTATINTLWTSDTDLRLYITTVQDG